MSEIKDWDAIKSSYSYLIILCKIGDNAQTNMELGFHSFEGAKKIHDEICELSDANSLYTFTDDFGRFYTVKPANVIQMYMGACRDSEEWGEMSRQSREFWKTAFGEDKPAIGFNR